MEYRPYKDWFVDLVRVEVDPDAFVFGELDDDGHPSTICIGSVKDKSGRLAGHFDSVILALWIVGNLGVWKCCSWCCC